LTVGAGFGADFYHWFPVAPYETMILLGMLAYFSGVLQSPITAFVIIMEMTDNHDVLLALMATSIIAHGTSRIVCPVPIYRAMALQIIEFQKKIAPQKKVAANDAE
jgi:H+/Cl- antiporter ClcA